MTSKGTMTNEERLRKTIRFEEVDKILSGPSIMQFAATYAGITQQQFVEDSAQAEAAYEKTFVDMGGWDIGRPIISRRAGPPGLVMNTARPGRDLIDSSVVQFVEREIMLPEDYDYVIDNGYNALIDRLNERVNPNPVESNLSEEEIQQAREKEDQRVAKEREKWESRGVVPLMNGMGSIPPFDIFSIHRSVSKFPMDVLRHPDKVKAAIKASMPDIIANAKEDLKKSPIKRIGTASSRSSGTFISNKQFEEFVLPTWLEFVWAMTDAGADIVFHCDCDWTRFMPYFKEFPRQRCLLQLDGATDIFKAREILGDHMALHGDVPAPLLTLATPEEVYAYCKKLIDEIGKDGGGFVLSSGCSTPDNSRVENVRAMVRAGNEETWI